MCIGDSAFENCGNIHSVYMGKNIIEIGDYAFNNCTSLQIIVFSEKIKHIGKRAFNNCEKLENVTISNGVKSIGDYAFWSCDNLQTVIIPNTVTTLGNYVFDWCSGLECVIFDGTSEQWNSISKGTGNTNLENAKRYCLGDGYIDNGKAILNKSGNMLMHYYSEADNIYTLPSAISIIEQYAFADSKNLSTVILPEGLKYIGDNAFECHGSSLRCIYIPDSVSTIDNNVFNYCNKLSDVYYGGSEEQFNAIIFGENNSKLNNATIHYNEKLIEIDGVVYSEDMATLVACSNQKSDSFVMSSSVKSISEYAFYNCDKIKSISISESVKSIDKNVFANCSELTSIYIPKTVTAIEDSAFLNCSVLSDIYFGGTEKEWNTIAIEQSNYAVWVANINYNHMHKYENWQTIVESESHKTGIKKSKCIECGCEKTENFATKHLIENVSKIVPNCSNVGYTAGVYCNDCKTYISGHKEIAKNPSNHVNTKKVAAVAATTEKAGYTEGVYCNDCKKYISGHEEIPRLTVAMGDLDGDSRVTAADARLALRASVGLESFDKTQIAAADADSDGKITAADARLILRASVGLEDLKKRSK